LFGSFLPGLLVGWHHQSLPGSREPTLSWNQLHSCFPKTSLSGRSRLREKMLNNQAFARAVSGRVLEGYSFDAGRCPVCVITSELPVNHEGDASFIYR
jgi:hypothetical protein